MGRLAGFTYRQVTRKLRRLGFEFDRIEKRFNELHVQGQKASKEVQIPVEYFLDFHQA